MEKVFSIVTQRYGLSPMDQLKNLDVNTTIWGMFMSATLQAAVHLGEEYRKIFDLQESTQDIFETVISSDSEIDH